MNPERRSARGEILKEVKRLNPDDLHHLSGKRFCYFCIAAGIPLESALHLESDMDYGPITSGLKCMHCYITEEESGALKPSKKESAYASMVLKIIDEYKKRHKIL